MSDDKPMARKLTGYSEVQSNLFYGRQQRVDEFVRISIKYLCALVATSLVDDMPMEQDNGTLTVTLTIKVGAPVPTSDAVLTDIESIMLKRAN